MIRSLPIYFYRLVNYSPFIAAVSFVLGGMLVKISPPFADFTGQVYSLWTPEAAPVVVRTSAAFLLGTMFTVFLISMLTAISTSLGVLARRRDDRRQKAEEMATEARAKAAADEVEAFKAWAAERLSPWKHFFEDVLQEPSGYSEVSDYFAVRRFGTDRKMEERDQDVWMLNQMIRWAICFTNDASPSHTKVFNCLDKAFQLAGEHDAWSSLRHQPDTQAAGIIVPYFVARSRGLMLRYSGKNDTSSRFAEFVTWAIAYANSPPTTAVVTSS